MKKITIDSDIRLICVKAGSFPKGIAAAFDKLNTLGISLDGRTFYGLSRPEEGTITYYAAVTENIEGEAAAAGCESRIVKKGNYISDIVYDFMSDSLSIGNKFGELLETEGLDPEGYCVEQYITNKDVICMIRLED